MALAEERTSTAYVEDILGKSKSRWLFREAIPTVVSAVSRESGIEFQLYRRFLKGPDAKREQVEWIFPPVEGRTPL